MEWKFFQYITASISVVAIIIVIFLFKRYYTINRRYRLLRKEDAKIIDNLKRERDELKKEIIEKLNMLAKKEEERQNITLSILEQREKAEKERREDLLNLVEYKLSRWQEEREEKLGERFRSFYSRLAELEERVKKLEDLYKGKNEDIGT